VNIEVCFICGEPTGRAGKVDDSIYAENGEGPFCEDCYDKRTNKSLPDPTYTIAEIKAYLEKNLQPLFMDGEYIGNIALESAIELLDDEQDGIKAVAERSKE